MKPELRGTYLDRIYEYLDQLGIGRDSAYEIFLQGCAELLIMNKMPYVQSYTEVAKRQMGEDVIDEFLKTGMREVNRYTGKGPLKIN